MEDNKKILFIFDVDGTLTPSRKLIKKEILETLQKIKSKNYNIGFVGGSDLKKQEEQLQKENFKFFDFMFSENGLVAYKNQKQFFEGNLLDFFSEETLQDFVNECLIYIAKLKIPQKRGTFVEYRKGLINISPIGRNCNNEERDNFEKYDLKNNIRKNMISHLKKTFPQLDLHYSIGGQISFDVFPKGWDKTFCLKHLEKENFDQIHFFGDKTFEGGNDFEIYSDKRIIGHSVKSYEDTILIVNTILN